MVQAVTVSELNSMNSNQFESVLGNVIELYPAAAASVKNKRPFESVTDLCDAFHTYLDTVNIEEKLKVLKLLAELGGRLATKGELSKESTLEQRSAGIEQRTPQQKLIMDKINQDYKEKFGFPFIICARENKILSIIDSLQKRFNNTREEEIDNAINEVKKICRLRILDIVKN